MFFNTSKIQYNARLFTTIVWNQGLDMKCLALKPDTKLY